jgi:glycosyltransferase involved in cell wall biosynthesis
MSAGTRMGARKRVLHFIESGGIYGAESVIINLSREMAAGGDYEPVIGCIVQRDDEAVDLVRVAGSLGVEAHRITISNWRVFLDLPLAARFIRRQRIDMIHCHGYKPTVYAFLISMLVRVRVMATCHLWFIDTNAPFKMRALIGVEKFLYRHFRAVVAVSEHIRDILLTVGADASRVHLIRNGIVLSDYDFAARARTPQPVAIGNLGEGEICVLNIARLTEQKAQRDLIAAAVHIKAAGAKLKIVIVGEGELRHELMQQIAAEEVGDVVSLLGFRSDIADLLLRADIFTLPSLDEGMPISLLEAVAAKVPVVVTAVGDIPKLIADGLSGMIVKRRDPAGLARAILALAHDAARRSELAEQAWQRLKASYSSTQMFERYCEVYRKVLTAA